MSAENWSARANTERDRLVADAIAKGEAFNDLALGIASGYRQSGSRGPVEGVRYRAPVAPVAPVAPSVPVAPVAPVASRFPGWVLGVVIVGGAFLFLKAVR